MSVTLAIYLLASFLLGAVPFGLVVSHLYGVDIRKQGSGNIGATNVYRCVGKIPGVLTFAADILKGVVPILVSALIFSSLQNEIGYLSGTAAMLGHCYSPFLGGNGGKGVATSFGVFLVLTPVYALISLLSFIAVFAITKYVSLGSIIATLLLLAQTYFGFGVGLPLACVFVISVVVIWRHRANIQRLLEGSEHRFGKVN